MEPTDENGYSKSGTLPVSANTTFYLKEVTAPTGYKIAPVQEVAVVVNQTNPTTVQGYADSEADQGREDRLRYGSKACRSTIYCIYRRSVYNATYDFRKSISSGDRRRWNRNFRRVYL